MGDINSHLEAYRKETVELGPNTEEELELANSVWVMMVRGLCSDLKFPYAQFPYAQFPCINLTGNELYEPLWEAIYQMGFKVLGVSYDGLAANHRLFRLHRNGSEDVYKVLNPHTEEKHYLFFSE